MNQCHNDIFVWLMYHHSNVVMDVCMVIMVTHGKLAFHSIKMILNNQSVKMVYILK
jgi:ABC-type branched-subunit amino acid transport system ATPase component